MLKIQFKDKRKAPFWVMEKTFSIGRTNKNHLSIDDSSISAQHAKILNKGETFVLKDLGSEFGTFVNGQRITQKNIVCGDTLTIGLVDLVVVDPLENETEPDSPEKDYQWSLIADASWLSGQEFPIIGKPDDVLTIGRSSQCNIVFPSTHLSRLHAEITINYSSLSIKDMGSANGTFVNDKKIATAQLHPGDRVRLDVYSFRVFGPGIKLPKSATSIMQAIPSSLDEKEPDEKQWKSKPTSPGNREEINLYKKSYTQQVVAGAVIVALLAAVTYVALGITGVLVM